MGRKRAFVRQPEWRLLLVQLWRLPGYWARLLSAQSETLPRRGQGSSLNESRARAAGAGAAALAVGLIVRCAGAIGLARPLPASDGRSGVSLAGAHRQAEDEHERGGDRGQARPGGDRECVGR